jgi:hypothetical protein
MADTCTDCITCDYENSITSFPLDTTAPVTVARYEEVDEPITMNFQWATRTIAPQFVPTTTGKIDDGSSSGSGVANITTLNFKGVTYMLNSVQIVKSTHNNWIIPTTLKGSNMEDMIITFQNESSSFATYVMIVLPILRSGAAQPSYIQGLSSSNPAPGTYSLADCLPAKKDSLFAYYVTCLDGYSIRKRPDNAYVFVAVEGIAVAASLMQGISSKIGATPILPFLSRFADKISSIGNGDFNQYILSTRTLLNPAGVRSVGGQAVNTRTDATNAYKCVTLDPDRDVVNDTLQVDVDSGTLLSNVLAERAGIISDTAPTQQDRSKQKKIELMFESVFGALAAFILVVLVGYSVYTYTNGPATVAASDMATSPWIIYLGITIGSILTGITIGVMVF